MIDQLLIYETPSIWPVETSTGRCMETIQELPDGPGKRKSDQLAADFDPFDPYRNQAREEVFLKALRPGQVLLYLWQNQNTVVIGKNQNCYRECRVDLLEEEGGHLARRLSGGGAVFHDLGNLNFTFLARREDFDVARQTFVILEAVKSFGILAEATGRNDITVDGRKFSGNAYYLSQGTCYQHGTLLIQVNPERIGRYLNVSRDKLKSKGVSSVRSRVMGLTEYAPSLTIGGLKMAIQEAFAKVYGLPVVSLNSGGQEALTQESIEQEAEALRRRYASHDWLYGTRIPFSYQMEHRYDWGGVEVQLSVEKGVITEAAVYTDALTLEWPQTLAERLTGLACYPIAIREQFVKELKHDPGSDPSSDTVRLILESL